MNFVRNRRLLHVLCSFSMRCRLHADLYYLFDCKKFSSRCSYYHMKTLWTTPLINDFYHCCLSLNFCTPELSEIPKLYSLPNAAETSFSVYIATSSPSSQPKISPQRLLAIYFSFFPFSFPAFFFLSSRSLTRMPILIPFKFIRSYPSCLQKWSTPPQRTKVLRSFVETW